MSETCNHVRCSDETDNSVELTTGETFPLCEDHAHMCPDGTPVEGYTPNDPSKFTRPEEGLESYE